MEQYVEADGYNDVSWTAIVRAAIELDHDDCTYHRYLFAVVDDDMENNDDGMLWYASKDELEEYDIEEFILANYTV